MGLFKACRNLTQYNIGKMKLIIGITAPQSTVLIKGQLEFYVTKGFDVYLLAPKSPLTEAICREEGVKLISVEMKRDISLFHDLIALIKILIYINRIKPDVVNFGTPKVSLLGLIAAKVLKVPRRIYTCRGFRFEHESGFKRRLLVLMEKLTVFASHRVICISKSVQDLGIENDIFDAKKSLVLKNGSSNGVNLKMFNTEAVNKENLEHLKTDFNLGNSFVFGFVGRLIDRKGVNELYEAFDKIYQHSSSSRLLLVGPVEEDQIKNKNLLDQIKSHPGIISVGAVPQDQVPLYFCVMNVLVLPAYWEGFGNVLIQGASMGVPVISTNSTGCKDAVSDKLNGELVEVGNVEQLYLTMKKFLADETLLKRYGQNGILWSKNFSSESIWNGLINIYNKEAY
jgi:glycosyltransferase involved in cell wall biosynthesis